MSHDHGKIDLNSHTIKSTPHNPGWFPWVEGYTGEATGQVYNSIRLVDIQTSALQIPGAEHGLMVTPVLVIMPAIAETHRLHKCHHVIIRQP